ncbi:LysR family transcriptional regulator [Vibrio gangliei]|uniref:LysR family transcriptional regulator n=1 Tax=Vibrio gangliei TaxID=2077090 RepID=UPI000D017787|nr:LysR substrate-binding domain-containing protein [Vibrio gangliei]
MYHKLPTIKELHSFIITAEELNFTAAANRLNVTQGAVSRQILSLEKRLNVDLFHRHARGLSLTAKGTEFLPFVEHTLNYLHRSIEHVAHDKQKIKLKAPSCITTWLLPKLMDFQQNHPEVDVELTSSIKHNVNFATEPFDAAIGYGNFEELQTQDSTLAYNKLFDEILTPVCTNQMTLAMNNIHDLEKQTWLHATEQQTDWRLWLSALAIQENALSLNQLKGKKNQHFATLDLSVNAAMHGFGIAIGDIKLAAQDIELGRLRAPFSLQVASGKGYYFIRPKTSHHSSSQAAHIEHLLAALLAE